MTDIFKKAMPDGTVDHWWRKNWFNSDYLWSACGLMVGASYLVEASDMRVCKSCEKVRISGGTGYENTPDA